VSLRLLPAADAPRPAPSLSPAERLARWSQLRRLRECPTTACALWANGPDPYRVQERDLARVLTKGFVAVRLYALDGTLARVGVIGHRCEFGVEGWTDDLVLADALGVRLLAGTTDMVDEPTLTIAGDARTFLIAASGEFSGGRGAHLAVRAVTPELVARIPEWWTTVVGPRVPWRLSP
jgi:hypothetical protein